VVGGWWLVVGGWWLVVHKAEIYSKLTIMPMFDNFQPNFNILLT
jgi:hypothetical protein